ASSRRRDGIPTRHGPCRSSSSSSSTAPTNRSSEHAETMPPTFRGRCERQSLRRSGLRDRHGIHVESVQQLDPRQLDVHVSTAALQRPVDIRILLPDGYERDLQRRYPVLYLFHGTSGRPSDWINFGNAE